MMSRKRVLTVKIVVAALTTGSSVGRLARESPAGLTRSGGPMKYLVIKISDMIDGHIGRNANVKIHDAGGGAR